MKKFYVTLAGTMTGLTIKRLSIAEDAVQSLSDVFDTQIAEFIEKDTLKIRFSGTCFKCDSDEILFVDQYRLPDVYQQAITDPNTIPTFTMSKSESFKIRSIFAIDTDCQTGETVLFQSSCATKVLEDSKYTFFFRDGTFHKLSDPGFVIDSKLSAIYREHNLYFRSYATVKRFLDLTEYFQLATNQQIEEFLANKVFVCDNIGSIVNSSDDWMRKRFASILELKILDQVKDIKTTAKKAEKYGVNIVLNIKDNQTAIVIPSEKKDVKQLLRFLNEEYYTGEITGTQYLTNSQTAIENIVS
ncbi:hypothetical protein FACS18942_09930 [Planctomycetales bacterium]|nr:hypothetical protein FACS18942_09930 [Planctomycetales bacterium]